MPKTVLDLTTQSAIHWHHQLSLTYVHTSLSYLSRRFVWKLTMYVVPGYRIREQRRCHLTLRRPINPRRIPKPPLARILEHLVHTRIRLILLIIHHNRHIPHRPPRRIPPRSIALIFGHCGVNTQSRIRRTPRNIATGFDGVVKITVCEDAAVQCIPWTPKCAFTREGE
jgi:hypothetical protein